MSLVSKQFIITIITLVVIGLGAAAAVFFAKGYTFSPKEGRVVGTGLLAISSAPDGASVYVDGHLATATNTTISQLKPQSYKVRIVKEGFIPWEKNVDVSEGLVTEIKATLFPALPTLYPLTVNGAQNPTLSPDGQKLAYAVPYQNDSHVRQKGGIWVWTMTNQPIAFARGAEPHQLIASTQNLDFSKASIKFSPDSTQVLVTLQENGQPGDANTRNYLLPVDRQSSLSDIKDITPMVAGTLKEWTDDQKAKDDSRVAVIQDLRIKQIASASTASASATIAKWSPDETKFMVISGQPTKATDKAPTLSARVYDLSSGSAAKSGSKNPTPDQKGQPLTGNKEYTLPDALAYYWLPDSRHVILVQEGKISIAELDGSNVAEIFAGNFEGTNVFPWPDSSKLVILTSFATTTASQPNLFGINLK